MDAARTRQKSTITVNIIWKIPNHEYSSIPDLVLFFVLFCWSYFLLFNHRSFATTGRSREKRFLIAVRHPRQSSSFIIIVVLINKATKGVSVRAFKKKKTHTKTTFNSPHPLNLKKKKKIRNIFNKPPQLLAPLVARRATGLATTAKSNV